MTTYAERQRAMFSSDKTDWETPRDFFLELDEEFHFTLDAAASDANAQCTEYFTIEDDGLSQPWHGNVVWINPPYGRGDSVGRWVRAAERKSREEGCTVVMLVPARTDTKWFHEAAKPRAEIRFVKGRLKFVGAPYNAPFPCVVLIFRPETKS